MTGLDKIIKHIEDEAALTARNEIEKAKERAEEILKEAVLEADKKCSEIYEESQNEIKLSLSRSESAAALSEKKLILNAKQEIIADVIKKAQAALTSLPDEEYIVKVRNMIRKYALNQKGHILFSASDLTRLPKDFESSIITALADKSDAGLSVSGLTADIDGGFILDYGDIQVNCSFEALISAARETLQDKVREILFQ